MPPYLLRDGSIRHFDVVPEGLTCPLYTDRHQRQIHVVLDAASERLLLRAQPRQIRGRRGAARRTEPPLAA